MCKLVGLLGAWKGELKGGIFLVDMLFILLIFACVAFVLGLFVLCPSTLIDEVMTLLGKCPPQLCHSECLLKNRFN